MPQQPDSRQGIQGKTGTLHEQFGWYRWRMHRIYTLWTTGQERARSDLEFEEKMRKLEKDGEELNRIKALIAA